MSYAEHDGHAHYVTARHGTRVAYLAGPYRTHREALAVEDQCRAIVRRDFTHDMDATFAAIGTSRVTTQPGRFPVGKLNGRLT